MKKFKMTELMIKDFEKKIEKFENGNLEKEIILNEINQISKTYTVPLSLKMKTMKLKKAEVKDSNSISDIPVVDNENTEIGVQSVEENISQSNLEEDSMELSAEKSSESDLTHENSIEVSTEKISQIKQFMKKHKKTLVAGVTVATLSIAGISLFAGNSKNKPENSKVEDISDDVDDTLNKEIERELSQNLSFDPLDKELEVEMMENFFIDVLPKGIELTETGLENQIDKWINFKNLANFDEFGISDLANKYQNDKVTYIDVYNDYTACATILTYDSLTASKENNELIDLSSIFAEKDALELVSMFQDMNGQLVDARKANDEVKMMDIAKSYNTLIEEKLLAHEADAYNPIAYDLAIRYALSAKEIVMDYAKVQNTLMDKSLEDVLAVNGQCLTGEEATKIMNGEITGVTNKYSANVIKMLEDVKLKFSEMYKNLDKDFSEELSQSEEVSMIAKYLLDNNLISTYVANISYEEYYYEVKELENTGSTISKGSVKVNNSSYVKKEEIYAKTGIDTENTNLSDSEIKAKYEEAVKKETEKKLEKETKITDLDGEVQENVTKEDYTKYYELGSSMGAQEAIGKTTKISVANIPSTVPSQYREIFNKAYIEAYNEVVVQNIKAVQETTTEYVPTPEQEVSKEEKIEISDPIKDEDVMNITSNSSRLVEIQNEKATLEAMRTIVVQYVDNYYNDIYMDEVKTYIK